MATFASPERFGPATTLEPTASRYSSWPFFTVIGDTLSCLDTATTPSYPDKDAMKPYNPRRYFSSSSQKSMNFASSERGIVTWVSDRMTSPFREMLFWQTSQSDKFYSFTFPNVNIYHGFLLRGWLIGAEPGRSCSLKPTSEDHFGLA